MQAYTLSKCLPLIEAHEESTCTSFSWIIRLRTDGWYNFRWNASSWLPPRNPSERYVYVTHCMGNANLLEFQYNKKAVTCTDRFPSQSGCASDQFAVVSRGAARAYFVTFLRKMLDTGQIRDYANVTLSRSAPPECVLSSALARHNVQQRALQVSASPDMRDPVVKLNWGPVKSEDDLKRARRKPMLFMRFPLSMAPGSDWLRSVRLGTATLAWSRA
eukprot:4075179-Prymnesium_polylepis.1